ncbi:MBL fold metallo-hydrolase [Rubrolithibacter danxiaensis]|uniref:MBL fold metallo-hydrolase n=1 Tax=Rubrolithibacter danxiaensis TaxID=3390805 RepID=UPI003BF9148F
MIIQQFEDKNLAHFSYAVVSECEAKIVLIDPARDIKPYLDFAATHNATIIAVIETHPHADFISGHFEIQKKTGATLYCSKLLAADYPHQTFDEGNVLEFGKIKLKALNTPGHSPDSISIVLEHNGKDKAVFTGDTLFIGDCGRPDLRETAGNMTAERKELARQMYYSLRQKLATLSDDVLVYPAHGAGTLCGKALLKANQSTIGAEKSSNWSLQEMDENQFVEALISDQPFVPKYFPFDVELNKKGAENIEEALSKISIGYPIKTKAEAERIQKNVLIVDSRPSDKYQASHLPNSINIMANGKFETWLGSIVNPGEKFYLAAEDEETVAGLLKRIAKIGYEDAVEEAFVLDYGELNFPQIDLQELKKDPSAYTIIDIRNRAEANGKSIFPHSVNIPLPELRERIQEVPKNKPVLVHCAGGTRSAAGSSLLASALPEMQVVDLGKAVKDFQ